MFASIVSKANFGNVEPKFVGTILAGINERQDYESAKIVPGECVHLVLDDSDENTCFCHIIKILNRNLEMLGFLEPAVAVHLAAPISFGDLLVCGRNLELEEPACGVDWTW